MKLKRKTVMRIGIICAALIILGAVFMFGINGYVVHMGGKYILSPEAATDLGEID